VPSVSRPFRYLDLFADSYHVRLYTGIGQWAYCVHTHTRNTPVRRVAPPRIVWYRSRPPCRAYHHSRRPVNRALLSSRHLIGHATRSDLTVSAALLMLTHSPLLALPTAWLTTLTIRCPCRSPSTGGCRGAVGCLSVAHAHRCRLYGSRTRRFIYHAP